MTQIIKQADVEYSADQMFLLVNDIAAYPDFLPWCTATNVMRSDDDSLEASVCIAVGKIKQTFTTKNTMQFGRSIMMQLVEGPFKQLHGQWQFQDKGHNGCVISLDLQFEFKSKLVKLALQSVFQKIMDSLVDAFIERAHSVYGEQ